MTNPRQTRSEFRYFERFTTRWRDNDVYGHLNNAVYYEYVDTLVNGWMMKTGALGVPRASVICLVVETGCVFHASLSFPDPVEAGLRVAHIGRSSVTYGIGLFGAQEQEAAALARFTHVCVDRETRRPTPLPATLRQALEQL